MIFTGEHAQMVLGGTKTQTRRPMKPGDYAVVQGPGKMIWHWHPDWPENRGGTPLPADAKILEVRDINGRLRWKVGQSYAAQMGRGKKAIGRTPRVEAIWRERLQEMRPFDCRAEMGVSSDDPRRFAIYLLPRFIEVWNSLYRKPHRWEEDPEVWALKFERVKETR